MDLAFISSHIAFLRQTFYAPKAGLEFVSISALRLTKADITYTHCHIWLQLCFKVKNKTSSVIEKNVS